MTQRTFGHWLWLLWCNVDITSAGAKAFQLHNNINIATVIVKVAVMTIICR